MDGRKVSIAKMYLRKQMPVRKTRQDNPGCRKRKAAEPKHSLATAEACRQRKSACKNRAPAEKTRGSKTETHSKHHRQTPHPAAEYKQISRRFNAPK
jgi:hypothetical protein